LPFLISLAMWPNFGGDGIFRLLLGSEIIFTSLWAAVEEGF